MKRLQHTWLFLAAALLSFSGIGLSNAAGWPEKPINLVVPYSPGGATDAVARLVGQRLSERLGQPVIVENKPGAGSNIGMGYVANSRPDGYTILLCANSLVTNNSLFDSLPFDGLRDFAPIGQIASAPLVVTVPIDSKIESFGQLLAAARANPGKLTYASAGNGSSSHLAGESLKQIAGIDVMHVPYKGAAPAIADVIGGRISFMTMNTIEITPYVQGHRVKMLAVAALDRIEQYPDLPTVKESGLPVYMESVWFGLAAPAHTPPDVIKILNKALQAIIEDPEMKQRFVSMGAVPAPGTTAQFSTFLHSEQTRIKKVVAGANITPN